MPNFAVSTGFSGKDKGITATLNKIGTAAERTGNRTDKAFRKASKAGSRFGANLRANLSANLISRGTALLTQGIGVAIREFIDFDNAIISASAKFKGLNRNTAEGAALFERLKAKAREVGSTTEFSAATAAKGLDFFALAGFNAEQAMALLPSTVDLATVAQVDMARAADIASDALGAFGLATDDTAQLQKNFTRLNDVMARTMTSTNTNIEDMFEAIKKGAPVFTSSGQSLESFNTLLGAMANSGIKGSEAGTALRNTMLRLSKVTPEAQKVLTDLGIKTTDSEKNFLDIVDIVGQFQGALKGMGNQQKQSALATIFGARTITGFTKFLEEGDTKLRAFRTTLSDTGVTAASVAGKMRESLGKQLDILSSAAKDVGLTFLDAFSKDGAGGIKALTTAINAFDSTPIIVGMKGVLELFKIVFNVGSKIAKLLEFTGVGFVVETTRKLAIAGLKTLGETEKSTENIAPNKEEAKSQQSFLTGLIEISGAPEGTTVKSKTKGSANIDLKTIGQQ